jgi:maltoporin
MILTFLNEKKLFDVSHAEIQSMMEKLLQEQSKINDDVDLKYLISDTLKEFQKLNPMFINKLYTNRTIARQVKKHVELKSDSDGKIRDTIMFTSEMIKKIEQKYNKLILAAKRDDSKTNRLKIKSEIMRFLKNNALQLKVLLDLRNKLIDIKQHVIKRT